MPPAGSTTAAPRRQARPAAGPRKASHNKRRRPGTTQAPLRIRWERVGRVLLVVVLAVVAGLYIQQGLTYLSVRSQADQQKGIAAALARQNARLAQEAKSLNNPATIVRDARELGMIKSGERPYVVTGLPGG